jgi:hypothetical protein
MAKVFIQPDSDGDLHTAAMHNNKFQVILNEINGNLDEKNLKYPNSILVLESDAGVSSSGMKVGGAATEPQRYPVGWFHVVGANYVHGWANVSNTVHIIQNSFHQTDRALSVVKVNFGLMKSTSLVAGQLWTATVETSPTVTAGGTWTTVATQGSIDLNNAQPLPVIFSVTPSSASIAASQHIRVTLTTPSGAYGEYVNGYADGANLGVPPPFWCKIICSTAHV